MKSITFLPFVFLVALVAGCGGDEGNRNVADSANQQAIIDYEAELAKVTSQDIEVEEE